MCERNLPPLLDENGQWTEERRAELLDLFARQVYGVSPEFTGKVTGTLMKKEDYPGLGRKEVVELSFDTYKGRYAYPLYVYFPEKASETAPVPMVLYIGNRPRKDLPMTLPPDITPEKLAQVMGPALKELPAPPAGGQDASPVIKGCCLDDALQLDNWPVEMLLKRGYATAAFYTEDLEPDYCNDGENGIICFFHDVKKEDPERWGAIAAWAFGASRALDYLTQDARVSTDIAVAGHSRGGKTALWCAANDKRVQCCYANDSGCTGAALSRGKKGERLLQINTMFPYWFCGNYKKYNDREEELPLDQHMLLALIAPRLLYLASATEDLWADPDSEFASALAADEAYRARNVEGLACKTIPVPGAPSHEGRIGYHVRSGGHALTKEDWSLFCDFWAKHQ